MTPPFHKFFNLVQWTIRENANVSTKKGKKKNEGDSPRLLVNHRHIRR